MNLLIVSDKSDVKIYQSIVKTAPNVSVLGAVTKVDENFISLLHEKYNPHAILFDVDVPVVSIDGKAAVEQIKQNYPYMKVLVLTTEDDDYDYSADCIIQGQISNIKLKEILQKLAIGSSAFNEESRRQKNDPNEETLLPNRISFDSNLADKLSTPKSSKKLLRFNGIHFNPLIIAGVAVGTVVLLVIILVIIKAGSGKGQSSTPDEAFPSIVTEPYNTTIAETTTEILDYPTFPPEYYTSVTEPESVVPPTIAPEPTAAPTTVSQTSQSEERQSSVSQSQTGGSTSGNTSNAGTGSSSSGNSNRNNNGSTQSSQPETKTYGGDPVVSYDDNGRYSNSGGNAVSAVKLSYSSKTLQVGDTLQLYATVSPSNANQSVTWNSSNTSVVTVKGGLITAKKAGNATITATSNNGKSAGCQVTVKNNEQTDTVHLSAAEYHLTNGQNVTIWLYGATECEWSTSNATAARIYPSGNQVQVYTRRTGTYKIYAKDKKTNKTYTCYIYIE